MMVLSDEERKAKRREYDASPERKAKRKAYRARPEVKTKRNARGLTPERIVKMKEYRARPEVKARKKELEKDYRVNLRMEINLHYSKIHSNSNVPCCRCCGLNDHVEFLALDHIAGRKKMDSEPELLKLGYSSNFKTTSLLVWIKKNNFPKGFQILCHNCNFAKGRSEDNKCPHERKHLEETFDRMTTQSSFEL